MSTKCSTTKWRPSRQTCRTGNRSALLCSLRQRIQNGPCVSPICPALVIGHRLAMHRETEAHLVGKLAKTGVEVRRLGAQVAGAQKREQAASKLASAQAHRASSALAANEVLGNQFGALAHSFAPLMPACAAGVTSSTGGNTGQIKRLDARLSCTPHLHYPVGHTSASLVPPHTMPYASMLPSASESSLMPAKAWDAYLCSSPRVSEYFPSRSPRRSLSRPQSQSRPRNFCTAAHRRVASAHAIRQQHGMLSAGELLELSSEWLPRPAGVRVANLP